MTDAARLFVYGSLRSDAPRPREESALAYGLLAASAVSEGPARIRGSLYAPSWYPAYVAAGEGWVAGEVWRIQDADVLTQLDEYEHPTHSRETRAVLMADGRKVTAWIYSYVANLAGVPPIPSGDYLDWVKQDAARA